jgi:chemotaxis protein methyltransferase CheR
VSGLPITPPLFTILNAVIEEHAGIHYEPRDADLVAEKISPRAQDLGFESLLDYYYFLRYDPAGGPELDALVENLLVHETYFFRELPQLQALVDTLLAPAIARGARPRIWCAAAATGEEPLTLAMLLCERELFGQVELVASDISERALSLAQRGEFGKRALRNLPRGYERWLRVDGERGTVQRELIDAIKWRRVNLLDSASVGALGRFDAILCRNVLIYFREGTARKVVERLAEQLMPDGALLVGVSESLLRFGTLLRCEERGGTFFYEKASS